jgi:hypothetical protein
VTAVHPDVPRQGLAGGGPVHVERAGQGRLRLVVDGRLDAAAATALTTAWASVIEAWPRSLELDLCQVTSSTDDGVSAVARCLALGRRLDDGVTVTVSNDAGRQALLESMAEV